MTLCTCRYWAVTLPLTTNTELHYQRFRKAPDGHSNDADLFQNVFLYVQFFVFRRNRANPEALYRLPALAFQVIVLAGTDDLNGLRN